MNMNRGDTFIVEEETHRGRHFTCVGVGDDEFYAGDTNGRMFKFKQYKSNSGVTSYRVYSDTGATWRGEGRIYGEQILRE